MPRREWRARLCLAVGGAVLGVLLLEAGLQALALVLQPEARGKALPLRAGRLRVLCIGDSNTYGLWLEREQAYPARLEAHWNAQPDGRPIDVVNLGVPGASTSRVLRDLPQMLDATDPDVVLLLLGVNDYWTRPVALEDGTGADPTAAPWLLRHSILYELLRLAWRSRDPRAREVEVALRSTDTPERRSAEGVVRVGELELDAGYEQGLDAGERGDSAALSANLASLAARLREREIPLYLLTYPARWDFYHPANRRIRAAAEQSDTPLVDLEPLFAARCPKAPCPAWFFPDHHPKAEGYDLMARALVQRLRRDGW